MAEENQNPNAAASAEMGRPARQRRARAGAGAGQKQQSRRERASAGAGTDGAIGRRRGAGGRHRDGRASSVSSGGGSGVRAPDAAGELSTPGLEGHDGGTLAPEPSAAGEGGNREPAERDDASAWAKTNKAADEKTNVRETHSETKRRRSTSDRERFLRSLTRVERKRWRRSRARRAAACVAVLAVCLVLALVVGDADYLATPVGWVPFVGCIAAIVGAFAYLQVLKRGLSMEEATDLGSCERGENVNFTIRFKNATFLYFTRIEARFFVADMDGNAVNRATTTMTLSPRETYDMQFAARFDHIGTYRAGLEHVLVSDYLRLFEAPIEGPKKSFVHVTPRIVAIDRIAFSNESSMESTKANRATLSDSLDYAGVRDYVPGDPLKTVHWKLSARSEDYLTRLFETYTNPGVSIVIDFFGPGETPEERMGMFDAVVETAFSVGRYAQLQGMDTEIHYVDRHGNRVRHVSWAKSDLPSMVSSMPELSNDPVRQIDALDLLDGQIRSQYGQNNLVVCTANISSEMVSTVIEAKLRHRQPLVFAIAPRGLEGRDRDRWAAPLQRLDAAGIGYVALTDVRELAGVRA